MSILVGLYGLLRRLALQRHASASVDSVLEQHRDRHGPHSSGYGSDEGGDFGTAVEVAVTHQTITLDIDR